MKLLDAPAWLLLGLSGDLPVWAPVWCRVNGDGFVIHEFVLAGYGNVWGRKDLVLGFGPYGVFCGKCDERDLVDRNVLGKEIRDNLVGIVNSQGAGLKLIADGG